MRLYSRKTALYADVQTKISIDDETFYLGYEGVISNTIDNPDSRKVIKYLYQVYKMIKEQEDKEEILYKDGVEKLEHFQSKIESEVIEEIE